MRHVTLVPLVVSVMLMMFVMMHFRCTTLVRRQG
jgi:hypothetical protein